MTTSEQGLQENAITIALREDIAKLQDHRKQEKTRLQKTITNLQNRHEELEGKIRSSQRGLANLHAPISYTEGSPLQAGMKGYLLFIYLCDLTNIYQATSRSQQGEQPRHHSEPRPGRLLRSRKSRRRASHNPISLTRRWIGTLWKLWLRIKPQTTSSCQLSVVTTTTPADEGEQRAMKTANERATIRDEENIPLERKDRSRSRSRHSQGFSRNTE